MASELLKEGYKATDVARALRISRSNCYSNSHSANVKQCERADDKHILERIKSITSEHPFWGYRRVWAWLKHRDGYLINRKRVYRIMKENALLVVQRPKKAKRTPQKSKPKPIRPREWWGIDMTKFMIPNLGWVYLVIVLDWFNKKIVGYNVGLRSRSKEWRDAMEMAVMKECSYGSREESIALVSDNGSQPTSLSFMKDMAILGLKQVFTSYDNPKGNADTERVMRTLKEELLWLEEFESLEEARQKISSWIEVDYNLMYVHSALGYMSPEEFDRKWCEVNSTSIRQSLRDTEQVKETLSYLS